jgi:hypothetical protein
MNSLRADMLKVHESDVKQIVTALTKPNHHVRVPMFACHFDRQQAVLIHFPHRHPLLMHEVFQSIEVSIFALQVYILPKVF